MAAVENLMSKSSHPGTAVQPKQQNLSSYGCSVVMCKCNVMYFDYKIIVYVNVMFTSSTMTIIVRVSLGCILV